MYIYYHSVIANVHAFEKVYKVWVLLPARIGSGSAAAAAAAATVAVIAAAAAATAAASAAAAAAAAAKTNESRCIGPLANRAERIEPGEPGQGNWAERLALGESGQANQAPGEAGPRIDLNINWFSNNMC